MKILVNLKDFKNHQWLLSKIQTAVITNFALLMLIKTVPNNKQ